MFKKIFLSLLLIVILVVAGVTVYFNMMDWNEHKAMIASQFSEATGKKIDFNGAVSFKLFPTPSLEASDVNIYDTDEKNQKIVLAKIQKLVASLSFKSLLQRRFNVEHMSMVHPEIFVEVFDDGKVNWQVAETIMRQDFEVKNVDVSFGSVIIDGAKVEFINKKHDIDLTFDNVNAEVMAGSFSGPYRIEGSYIKNGDSRGFAFDLGKFSDSFATSINAVLTHPQSESYVRFDGTVMLKNEAVNGNLLIESKNPINFASSIFSKVNLSEVYENPLALSLVVKSDKDQISLSNIVLKYADSAGAGNVFIPLANESALGEDVVERPQIEATFNFTDLNMDMVVLGIKDFLKKYDGNEYAPDFDFDVIADIKSLKTTYNGQIIRDFDVSVDFVDNVFTLQNLAAGLPFDGNIKIKGDMTSKDKMLNYYYNVEMETLNFAQTSEWLGIDLKPISKNIYKRAAIKFTLTGTPQTIKLSPFIMNLDKTSFDAKLALVRGDKNKYFAIINADSISFDNYIELLPEDMQKLGLQDKVDYYVKKIDFLKDIDLQLKADLRAGIWQRTPFEKTHIEAVLNDGVMKISDFSIGDVLTSKVDLKGEVFGFGDSLQFKNVKYAFDVRENKAVIEKFGIDLPSINWKNLPSFVSEGVATGNFNRLAVKSFSKLAYIDADYEGEISKQDEKLFFDGKLGVRSNDVLRTLHDFSVDYNPPYPLGLLKISADIKNTADTVLLKDMNLNVGVNNFSGDVLFSKKEDDRMLVKSNLNINKFEFERFFYNAGSKDGGAIFRGRKDNVPFLEKPLLSKVKINYDFMKDIDVEAKINVADLSYDKYDFKNASWLMSLKNQNLRVVQFVSENNGGIVSADFELNVPQQNNLKGKCSFKDVNLKKEDWSGLLYGLESGLLSMDMTFETTALSMSDMFNNMTATGKVVIGHPKVKGWDISAIIDDLRVRRNSDNLRSFVQGNLTGGNTEFDSLSFDFVLRSGSFDVNNAVFEADDYSVEAKVVGGFETWLMNADFIVNNKIENLPNFSFGMDGDISAPTLDIDVENLSKFYDRPREKKAVKVKTEKELRAEKYRKLMEEQQNRAKVVKQQLQTELLPKFNKYKDKAKNQKIQTYYGEIEKQIMRQNVIINEVLLSEIVNIDDSVIEKVSGQIDAVEAELGKIIENFDFVHGQDVRIRMNESFADVVAQTAGFQEYSGYLLDIEGKLDERLAAINTKYSLSKDEIAAEKKQKMADLINQIESISIKARNDMNVSKDVKDIEELEAYVDSFDELSNEVKLLKQELEEKINDYKSYTELKGKEEEDKAKMKEAMQSKNVVIDKESSFGTISTAGGKKKVINFGSE